MNTALHTSYKDMVLNQAVRRGRINSSTGAEDLTTGEKLSLSVLFSNALKDAWEKPRGRDWAWPFVISSGTFTVTSGALSLSDLSYPIWVSLWSADPRPASTSAYRIPVRVSDASGIYPQDTITSLFALYIARVPQFNSTAWAANTAYDAGTIRYDDTTGQCWRAKIAVPSSGILLSNTTYWEEQLIPLQFQNYLTLRALSDYCSISGKPDESAKLNNEAMAELDQEFAVAFRTGPSGSGKPWISGGTWT